MEKSKQLRKQRRPKIAPLVYVRGRRFFGYKFRRQMLVGPYIVDFACFKAKLLLSWTGAASEQRGMILSYRVLNANGWEVVRF
ncbi:MAG: DUF559 domain-containing protein [Enterobacter hormaechei]